MPNGLELPAYLSLKTKRNPGDEAEFFAGVDSLLSGARKKIRDFSAEAQRDLDAALSVKRNNAGSLDLGIDQMREAAAAQQARAVAAREVANATLLALQEEKLYTEEMKKTLAAAKALASAEEGEAAVLRSKIAVLEQVQQRLNQNASATDMVVAANKRGTEANHMMVNSQRAARVASIQFGQQMQDVVVQMQMGTKGMTIFTQQVPQMAFALSGLAENTNPVLARLGKLGTTLSGPVGAGLIAATALLGPFIANLFESGDAAEKSGSATDRLANKLDVTKNSYQALMDVVREYNKQQEKSAALSYDSAIAAEKEARKQLELAKARVAGLQSIPHFAGEETGGRQVINSQISAALATIAGLEKDLAEAGVTAGDERVKRQTDPRYNIEVGYNQQLLTLSEQRKQNIIDQNKYEAERLRLITAQTAALKAYDDAHKSSGSGGGASANNVGTMRSTLDAIFGDGTYIGDNKKHSKFTARGTVSDHFYDRALDFVPEGGMGKYTKAEVHQMLIEAGVKIRRNAQGVEQFFGPGDKGHNDHFHVAWEGQAPEASKATERLQKQREAMDRVADSIQQINSRWDEQPRLVDRITQDAGKLDDTIESINDTLVNNASLTDEQRAQYEAMYKAAIDAREKVGSYIDTQISKQAEASSHEMQMQALISQGLDDQAAIQDAIYRAKLSMGDLDEKQIAAITRQVQAQYDFNEALRRAQEIQSAYLDASRSIRGELEAMFSGEGSLANIPKIFQRLQSKILVEKLFGDMFRDLDKWVMKNTGLDDATIKLVDNTNTTGNALLSLATVINQAKASIATGGASSKWDGMFQKIGQSQQWDGLFQRLAASRGAANDNPITVIATKPSGKQSVNDLSPMDFFKQSGDQMAKAMTKALDASFDTTFFSKMSGALGGAFAGYAATGGSPIGAALGLLSKAKGGNGGIFGTLLGGMAGGNQLALLSQSLGLGGSTAGAQIGGALGSLIPGGSVIGSVLGLALGKGKITGKAIGGALGGIGGYMLGTSMAAGFGPLSMLGAAGGPVGAIVGLVLGGLLGGLFGSKPKGSGTVSNSGYSGSANRDNITENLTSLGSGVNSAIDKIGAALGVKAGSYALSVGMYKDWYQVSNIANDPLIGKAQYNQKSSNEAYDGKDAQAALVAAIKVAINQGAFKAIGATANRILANGSGDIDQAVQDTKDFLDVFKTLKQYTDPVGAALDDLDTKFSHLKEIFTANGATAEEYAQLEKLYGIERTKAIEAANNQILGSLKSLYEQLTVGDSGLSLKDRLGNAMGNYTSLEGRVKAGDTTAYDAYAKAAQTVLDLNRQIYGSQQGYFAVYDQIKGVTGGAIDAQTSVNTASANRDSPFTVNPASANDNQGVIDALDVMNSNLNLSNQYLAIIAANYGGIRNFDANLVNNF